MRRRVISVTLCDHEEHLLTQFRRTFEELAGKAAADELTDADLFALAARGYMRDFTRVPADPSSAEVA